jgi:hypothetical protein
MATSIASLRMSESVCLTGSGDFEEITPEPLRGRQWRGVFKLRVGDYRISTQPIGANCSLRFTSSVIVAKSIDNACL